MTEGADTTTMDYAGNYIYQNNVLQMISQPEGYIEPNTQGDFDYIYQYKDHLGNIRLSYKDDEFYDTDFNEGVYSPWQASVNTTSMTIEDDRLKVVTGVHLNGANGYYDLLAGETYEISVDVDRDMFTTDLEFSLWKGNSKIYGEYVTTSKTVTYEYTPTATDTYRINFRLRDYGYAGADQTFYLDNVIIRNTALALIEENNYYPFGLKHQGYNSVVSSNANAVATKFKYNGKELQDDDVNGNKLNLYDYGARMYDPALGRFHSVDPLAHKRSWVSPYNFVQNNPISRVDPTGALDGEFEEVVKEDGTKTKTKISDLGDAEGIDFTHIKGGAHDGQTRIESQTTGHEVYMKSSKNIEGFTKRDGGINWNTIYDEFLSGTGPDNSLISTPGMLQDIMQSPQFADAFQTYLDAGAPEKMGFNPSFGISGIVAAGDNMTAQMIGKSSYSFYNVGDKLVITIMDSKSVMSYSLNPFVKILPESWVNEYRSSSSEPVPQGTTRQTYLMMLDIKKQ